MLSLQWDLIIGTMFSALQDNLLGESPMLAILVIQTIKVPCFSAVSKEGLRREQSTTGHD